MEMHSVVVEDIVVCRGVEFAVKIELEKGLLNVEISDSMTADQWRGEFDPACIEDLTRKSGNFKQFPIFCSMLESAVKKTSDSVTLDILTYADLELLRNKKARAVGLPHGRQQCPALCAKRYLILIYTVEFDRMHYPLRLLYQGKPDPAALQKEIRALRTELNALTCLGGHKPAEPETPRLRAELASVREEKDALAKALERLQVDGVGPIPGGGGAWRDRDIVRTLEEQLIRDRAKGQRSASKRGQDHRLLMEQLEELRASERALRIRVKGLINELALLRRGRVSPHLSRCSGSRGEGGICRSLSREQSLGHAAVRARSGSRKRVDDRRQRSEERGGRADSSGPHAHIPRPSPTGSRVPRFDPTAYIQDRLRRQKEAELKNQRKICRDMMTSPVVPEMGRSRSRETYPLMNRSGSNSRGRSLSVEQRRSRHSFESSLVDMEEMANSLMFRRRKQTENGPTMSAICTGSELSEIDIRLQALQEYMRDLDTGN